MTKKLPPGRAEDRQQADGFAGDNARRKRFVLGGATTAGTAANRSMQSAAQSNASRSSSTGARGPTGPNGEARSSPAGNAGGSPGSASRTSGSGNYGGSNNSGGGARDSGQVGGGQSGNGVNSGSGNYGGSNNTHPNGGMSGGTGSGGSVRTSPSAGSAYGGGARDSGQVGGGLSGNNTRPPGSAGLPGASGPGGGYSPVTMSNNALVPGHLAAFDDPKTQVGMLRDEMQRRMGYGASNVAFTRDMDKTIQTIAGEAGLGGAGYADVANVMINRALVNNATARNLPQFVNNLDDQAQWEASKQAAVPGSSWNAAAPGSVIAGQVARETLDGLLNDGVQAPNATGFRATYQTKKNGTQVGGNTFGNFDGVTDDQVAALRSSASAGSFPAYDNTGSLTQAASPRAPTAGRGVTVPTAPPRAANLTRDSVDALFGGYNGPLSPAEAERQSWYMTNPTQRPYDASTSPPQYSKSQDRLNVQPSNEQSLYTGSGIFDRAATQKQNYDRVPGSQVPSGTDGPWGGPPAAPDGWSAPDVGQLISDASAAIGGMFGVGDAAADVENTVPSNRQSLYTGRQNVVPRSDQSWYTGNAIAPPPALPSVAPPPPPPRNPGSGMSFTGVPGTTVPGLYDQVDPFSPGDMGISKPANPYRQPATPPRAPTAGRSAVVPSSPVERILDVEGYPDQNFVDRQDMLQQLESLKLANTTDRMLYSDSQFREPVKGRAAMDAMWDRHNVPPPPSGPIDVPYTDPADGAPPPAEGSNPQLIDPHAPAVKYPRQAIKTIGNLAIPGAGYVADKIIGWDMDRINQMTPEEQAAIQARWAREQADYKAGNISRRGSDGNPLSYADVVPPGSGSGSAGGSGSGSGGGSGSGSGSGGGTDTGTPSGQRRRRVGNPNDPYNYGYGPAFEYFTYE